MPHVTRRGSQRFRPAPMMGKYYRPAKRPPRFSFSLLIQKIKKLPRRFLIILGATVLVVALATTGIVLLHKGPRPVSGPGGTGMPGAPEVAKDPTVKLPPRKAALQQPLVTADPVNDRIISFGSAGLQFKEKQINQPAVFGNEIFYSGGTGSLDSGAVLKGLYLYNIDTGKEQKIASTDISYGEFYEPQINKDWLVWLETDHHDKNYIYAMNRSNGQKTQIRSCKNGMPKLKLAGNTLIWMEPVDKTTNQLIMYDLKTQENMSLSNFTDVVTYGVSTPCVFDQDESAALQEPGASPSASLAPTPSPSPTPTPTPTPKPSPTPKPAASKAGASASPTGDTSGDEGDGEEDASDDTSSTTIVWAGHDPGQTADQAKADGERSAIFWVLLDQNAVDANGNINKKTFATGTYVHEPVYNGKYFAWIDGNYAPNSRLYLSLPNGQPKLIDDGITTYSLGDGIVVYGKDQKVWVYVIDTGETCCLTRDGEKGILPYVNGRTVIWYDTTNGTGSDVLRYEALTDQDLIPGAH